MSSSYPVSDAACKGVTPIAFCTLNYAFAPTSTSPAALALSHGSHCMDSSSRVCSVETSACVIYAGSSVPGASASSSFTMAISSCVSCVKRRWGITSSTASRSLASGSLLL